MSLRDYIFEQARKDRKAFSRLPKQEQRSIERQWEDIRRRIAEANAEAEAGRWSSQ
jgi:hypothetical protein